MPTHVPRRLPASRLLLGFSAPTYCLNVLLFCIVVHRNVRMHTKLVFQVNWQSLHLNPIVIFENDMHLYKACAGVSNPQALLLVEDQTPTKAYAFMNMTCRSERFKWFWSVSSTCSCWKRHDRPEIRPCQSEWEVIPGWFWYKQSACSTCMVFSMHNQYLKQLSSRGTVYWSNAKSIFETTVL